MELTRGTIICAKHHGAGIVVDILKGETEILIRVLFAKNIIKLQEAELHPFARLLQLGFDRGDQEDFMIDLTEWKAWYAKEMNARENVALRMMGVE